MGWEVVFAPRSEGDLAKIVNYIANDDPAAAIRFGETLINKAEATTIGAASHANIKNRPLKPVPPLKPIPQTQLVFSR